MKPVFISYSTKDDAVANRLKAAFGIYGIDAWFAPLDIDDGGEFLEKIYDAIEDCQVVVVLLSKNAMASRWCIKEMLIATDLKKEIRVLRIDREPLQGKFKMYLVDVQMLDAYHLENSIMHKFCRDLTDFLKTHGIETEARPAIRPISCGEIGMKQIATGDPWFEEGRTLHTRLTDLEFYLAPPRDGLDGEQLEFLDAHNFAGEDRILDTTLEYFAENSGIPDLLSRIDESKKLVLNDFLQTTNGCYFNNKKYGINQIRPYGRTEDRAEQAELSVEFFTTDYYTHRVMKDVCKKYYVENPEFFRRDIDFAHIAPWRILFTSLGINLLLFDTEGGVAKDVLLTCRSTNSAETYGKINYSMSVIEGVSLSDYDEYTRSVKLRLAVERGLWEEQGVPAEYLRRDSLKFYDLFVNLANLEIGISCSVELYSQYSLENITRLRGKDHVLEVAEKRILPAKQLHEFLFQNRDAFLTQAVYAIGSYLESIGADALEYMQEAVSLEEVFIRGKRKGSDLCGDAICQGEHYFAVIDGNTPKGSRLWDGLPSDVFVAAYLKEQMEKMEPGLDAGEVITRLNQSLKDCYAEGEFETMAVEERLSASVLIYSRDRREIWSFGDCAYRINGTFYRHEKKIDQVLSDVRGFYLETELMLGKTVDELLARDTGREMIMPLLKRQMLLANRDCLYGYDVLDGGDIHVGHIDKHVAKVGDHVVFASDGYPTLCETLAESERLLEEALENDPLCMHENRGTKAIESENRSYDDRCFLSFVVR